MNTSMRHLMGGLACLAAAAMLTACGGGGDDVRPVTASPDVTEQVPVAASSDSNAATAYVDALSATPPAANETKEPVDASAPLATSDNDETS